MRYIEEREQTPVVGEYDVIVAGGGVAGRRGGTGGAARGMQCVAD